MARDYKKANDLLVHDEEKPFPRRTFWLLLLASPLVVFDATHANIDAVLKPAEGGQKKNQEVGRFALRTQVIKDPTRPLGGGAEILQFFMLDPNHDLPQRGNQPGVIYEVGLTPDSEMSPPKQGEATAETPLVLLNASEVDFLVHGEGYATPLRG